MDLTEYRAESTFSPMPVRPSPLVRTCALMIAVCAAVSCSPGRARELPRAVEHASPGGVLRMISEVPRSLDPSEADSVYESLPLNQIFNGLVAIDASMNIVPELASTWTISRDGRTYLLRLQKGVRFHDGSLMTADDVVYTFRRLLAPRRRGRNIACSYLQILEGAQAYSSGRSDLLPGVAAVDPFTVKLVLARPYYSFLQVLAMDGLKIVPRAVVERVGDQQFGRSPVGTGPFRLAAWEASSVRLAANREYFGDRPHLDGVDIEFFAADETDSGASRFVHRQIDVVDLPAEALPQVSANPDILVHRYQGPSLTFLGMSSAIAPLKDLRMRQAIAHAINARGLVRDSPEMRREATGILPPGFQGYSPQRKTLAYDPVQARRLLAEAGHPQGRGLAPIDLFCSASNAAAFRSARLIQADLHEVGIEVRVREVPWGELSERVDQQVAPLFLLSWVADLADPDAFMRTLFESEGSSNFFDFNDPEAGSLLTEGALETNPVKRADIYRRCETRTLKLAPLVPLYYPISYLAVRSRVRGLEPGPLGLSNVKLGKVWLAARSGSPS